MPDGINEDFIIAVTVYGSFIFTGVLFIGLAIPMVLRKVPPNQYCGWRTPKAFESEEIWYQINWYCGRDMLILGLIETIYNVVLLCFSRQLGDLEFWLSVPGNLFILIAGTLVMMARGFRYLKKL